MNYSVMVWSNLLNKWILPSANSFASIAGADMFAARKNYNKYLVIPTRDFEKVNNPEYPILTEADTESLFNFKQYWENRQ